MRGALTVTPPEASRSVAGRAAQALAGALGPLGGLALAAPFLPFGELTGALFAFFVASVALVVTVSLAPLEALARPRVTPAVVAVGVAAALVAWKLPLGPGALVGSLAVLAVGSAVGATVGTRMETAGHILAVALVSAAVDIWSVNAPSGVTHKIVQTPSLLRLLTIHATVPPTRTPEPMIGFGDVVFAALYVSASRRFGLSSRRTWAALFAGILMAGAAAAIFAAGGGVPALPFLGLAMVVAHPATRKVAPEDRKATAFAALVLAAAVAKVALR